MIRTLNIDIETFSDVELDKCGVYKYASSPAFEILLFGVSVNKGDPVVYDLASGEQLPAEIIDALNDETVIKSAWNCAFERICISRYLHDIGRFEDGYGDPEDTVGEYLNPVSWRDTALVSAYNSLPLSLKGAGEVLFSDEDSRKMSEGADMIRYFCKPCKPTKANGGRTRNLPTDAPEKWERFKKYNCRDVEVEMHIRDRLAKYPVPDQVWREFFESEKINDRGVLVDREFVQQAVSTDVWKRAQITEELIRRTGLENPNSVLQMIGWLADRGCQTTTLDKKRVAELIPVVPKEIRQVLELRQQAAKSSVKKYTTMLDAMCPDGRIRGMTRFYGANRTGRFAGRLVQLQNLPQNHLPDLEEARMLVKQGDLEGLDLLYDSVPQVLSELIRTSFVPKEGCKFIVSDYAAIEARVIAYIAGEQWRMDAFKNNEDIYCVSASRMFGVPVVKHGINGHLRQKGKTAELALGYGGGPNAMIAMGALENGMKEEELQPTVDAWRAASPHICQLWTDFGNAAKTVIQDRRSIESHGMVFSYRGGMLFVTLPSGRQLAYAKPRIEYDEYGRPEITYEGIGSVRKWTRLKTWGGKITENIVQAFARDVLCYAIMNLRDYHIVMHIHDEVVVEVPESVKIETITRIMGQTPPWTEGLVLRADGYECRFYQKD